jgi:hypothetical protein
VSEARTFEILAHLRDLHGQTMYVKGSADTVLITHVTFGHAHLDIAQVRAVRDALTQWLDERPPTS